MIAKCCDWSILATGFAAFLLADSKYAQLVKCESTIKGLVSAYSLLLILHAVVKLSSRWNCRFWKSLLNQKPHRALLRNILVFLEKPYKMQLQTKNVYAESKLLNIATKDVTWKLNRSMKMSVRPLTSGFCRWEEKSMVKYRSLRVWFVRKQCDLQLYSTNWILKASKGWFTCWKNRYGLNLYKVGNLSNSIFRFVVRERDVPQDNVEAFLVDLQKLKDEYTDETYFNADEIALFYRLLLETGQSREITWLLLGRNSRKTG